VLIQQGDWVRAHYDGWASKFDEWVCFCPTGFVCAKVTEKKKECHCARHPEPKPLRKVKMSAPMTFRTRPGLSDGFWKKVKQIKLSQE
jgi:hypothetical protein